MIALMTGRVSRMWNWIEVAFTGGYNWIVAQWGWSGFIAGAVATTSCFLSIRKLFSEKQEKIDKNYDDALALGQSARGIAVSMQTQAHALADKLNEQGRVPAPKQVNAMTLLRDLNFLHIKPSYESAIGFYEKINMESNVSLRKSIALRREASIVKHELDMTLIVVNQGLEDIKRDLEIWLG